MVVFEKLFPAMELLLTLFFDKTNKIGKAETTIRDLQELTVFYKRIDMTALSTNV